MAVPAVIVELAGAWSLDASQIGWLGGIFFAGYAAGLPLLSGAAARTNERVVYAISALIAALASLGFATLAEGFWSALVLRFIAGIGFSGIHIIGMKLMADRLDGTAQARAAAFYSAAYAFGSATSFLIAGPLAARFGWPAAFIAAGIGALLAIPALLLIGPPLPGRHVRSARWLPDFRGALRVPETRRFILAYGGNTWEVFAMRVWFVPVLAFNASQPGHAPLGLSFPMLAGLSALLAIPVSIAVAETGIRVGAARVVRFVSLASVAVCLLLGLAVDASPTLLLALLVVHGATSYGDAGAINGGLVTSTNPETRSAALALFGLTGFIAGFLGSLAVGLTIDLAGGASQPSAWAAGFVVIGLGSVVAAAAMTQGRPLSGSGQHQAPAERGAG